MSGFVKKAKKKAGLLVDKLRPSSTSPAPPAADPVPAAPSSNRHTYADPSAPPTAVATTASAIYELLAVTRDGSDMFLPLKAALTGVVKIWDICERTKQVKEEYEKLESRLAHLNAVTQAYGKKDHLDPDLKLRLDSIAYSFGLLDKCVKTKLERGLTGRVLESKGDVDDVKDLLAKISMRIEAFLYESTIRVEIAVNDILSRLPTTEQNELKEELARWEKAKDTIKSVLGGRRVDEAAHNVQSKDAGCLHGTREGVLSRFMAWIQEDSRHIFWLAGMAGTGKTSVAVTLCRMLDSDPTVVLGGGFFCSRIANVEGRTDVRRILPTLAVLLSRQSPKFAVALAAEIRPNSGVAGYEPVSDQIGRLLKRPLSALASETRPIVFVIDALDECAKEGELAELLMAITKFQCDANVKFILTSRPETHILGGPISDRAHNGILQLHMIEVEEVTEDIRLYIDDAFSKKKLAKPWYTEADVTALATLSNGLFIFASTVITYVLRVNSVSHRRTRLQTALAAVGQSAVAIGSLDAMYEFVLTGASNTTNVEPEELEMTRRNLACILAARAPLSITALSDLLELDTDALRESLRHLHATIYVPDDDDESGLRTLHASFGDYLLERAPVSLRISLALGEEILARGCLRSMKKSLHFNVSRSRSSYEPNSPSRPDSIPYSLEYACVHWIYHIAGIPAPTALGQEIDDVIRPKFLFWLEVMSVLGQVRRAAAMLTIAVTTLQSTNVSQFLRDANTFVASSRDAIARSAPHIYLSALPFAAKDSLIYQIFIPQCTGLIAVETHGIDRHGGRLVMTFIGHGDSVYSATYSPDGSLLASGGSDGAIRLWNTRTGEEAVSPLHSGDGAVQSVAFAPNGKVVASATQAGVICVWSNLNGVATAQRLHRHSAAAGTVMFSPDGSLLASGSEDKTVRIWKVETGEQIAALNSHTEEVDALAFSRDGSTLASGSYDQTIRLWCTNTWKLLREPLRDPNGVILSLAFSPDGTKLASGSSDGNITFWEPQTGRSIAVLPGPFDWWVRSVQFSPDGLSLVSAGDQHRVRLWTLGQDTGKATSTTFVGHTRFISSTTFSPDGLYIASTSVDGTIRIWDAASGQTDVQPLDAHDVGIESVAVSPDSSFIVSGCNDHSVGVWSIHTGERKLGPLLGNSRGVSSVATSSDGHLIASASGHTVYLWDAHTGEPVRELLHAPNEDVLTIAFSPDARLLASGTDDYIVRMWNAETWQLSTIGSLHCGGRVTAVAFSPDGRLLGAGDAEGRFYVWHAATGKPVREPFSANAYTFAFSPACTHIVSRGSENAPRIWDISTGQQVLVLEGHTKMVTTVSYSHDGRFVVSGSMDQTVRVWDSMTGTSVAILHGHRKMVESIVFTSDNQSIVSCGHDSTIRVWHVETAQSLLSAIERNAFAALSFATLNGGWMSSQSGNLLLWVPEPYHNFMQIAPCTMLIGSYRIIITAAENSLHTGQDWIACWRDGASDFQSRAL